MNSMNGSLGPTGQFKEKIPSGYRAGAINQYTPQQQQLFGQQFQHVGPESYLGRLAGGDQSMFEEMEAPAHRQFAQTIGGLASRFSGMGTGSRHSSGFQNTATAAGSNFAQDLASRRQELQRQAISDLMGMSNTLLSQRPQERFLTERQQKPSWMQAIAPLAGAGIGALVGGPMGMAVGGQLGSAFGSGFGGQPSRTNYQGMGQLPTSFGGF